MTTRIKNVLVFSISLLLATGVYGWFYTFNKGTLVVNSNQDNYFIQIDNRSTECLENPCSIKLKAGPHSIITNKSGFYPQEVSVSISKGKTEPIELELKKIPTLTASEDPTFNSGGIFETPNEVSPVSPTANKDGSMLAFIDSNDEKVKIFNKEGKLKVITIIRNLSSAAKIHWSSDNNHLFIQHNKDGFIINIDEASRKKVTLDFEPNKIIWSNENSYLLMSNNENGLFKFDAIDQTITPLETTINLSNAVWSHTGDLIYFESDNEFIQTSVKKYNFELNQKESIITEYNFPISQITSDDSQRIYLYNSDSNRWYHLDY